MLTSIVIPVWNKLEYTQGCVEHLRLYTADVPHEVIFVDNGSDDGTTDWLRALCQENPNYTLIVNERNMGFPVACNQGLALAKGDRICFLNNDVMVTPEWLAGLNECMDHRPGIGIVGPRTNCISGIQQVNDEKGYSSPLEMIEYARSYRKAFRGRYFALWRIVGFCMLVRREVFDTVGTFDEQFSPGNFEDDDLCLRATNAGFINYCAGDVFVHHFGSASWSDEFRAVIERNKNKYLDKWQKTTVSCCMIVKDEEAVIEKCLERASPLFDEIIVVDTGSKDRTKEIAAGFPKVKLFDFPWRNDFAAARNYSLDQATMDWIYVLDADEILPELDRTALWPMQVYRYETRNYTDNALWAGNVPCKGEHAEEIGAFWFPSCKIRLFPNDKRIRFQFPVHEVVEESCYSLGLYPIISSVPVHHYGKISEERDAQKGERYLSLLEGIVADRPTDERNIECLATQAQCLHQWDHALRWWDRLLSVNPDSFPGWLNKGHCIASRDGDWTKALECFEKARKLKPGDKDAKHNASFCLFQLGRYGEARDLAAEVIRDYPDFALSRAVYNSSTIKLEEMKDGNEPLRRAGS